MPRFNSALLLNNIRSLIPSIIDPIVETSWIRSGCTFSEFAGSLSGTSFALKDFDNYQFIFFDVFEFVRSKDCLDVWSDWIFRNIKKHDKDNIFFTEQSGEIFKYFNRILKIELFIVINLDEFLKKQKGNWSSEKGSKAYTVVAVRKRLAPLPDNPRPNLVSDFGIIDPKESEGLFSLEYQELHTFFADIINKISNLLKIEKTINRNILFFYLDGVTDPNVNDFINYFLLKWHPVGKIISDNEDIILWKDRILKSIDILSNIKHSFVGASNPFKIRFEKVLSKIGLYFKNFSDFLKNRHKFRILSTLRRRDSIDSVTMFIKRNLSAILMSKLFYTDPRAIFPQKNGKIQVDDWDIPESHMYLWARDLIILPESMLVIPLTQNPITGFIVLNCDAFSASQINKIKEIIETKAQSFFDILVTSRVRDFYRYIADPQKNARYFSRLELLFNGINHKASELKVFNDSFKKEVLKKTEITNYERLIYFKNILNSIDEVWKKLNDQKNTIAILEEVYHTSGKASQTALLEAALAKKRRMGEDIVLYLTAKSGFLALIASGKVKKGKNISTVKEIIDFYLNAGLFISDLDRFTYSDAEDKKYYIKNIALWKNLFDISYSKKIVKKIRISKIPFYIILDNLVKNTINHFINTISKEYFEKMKKRRHESPIKIRFSYNKDNALVFSYSDSGKGINKKEYEKKFYKWEKHGPEVENLNAKGLGVWIIHKTVKTMGWSRKWKFGRKYRFILKIPVEASK